MGGKQQRAWGKFWAGETRTTTINLGRARQREMANVCVMTHIISVFAFPSASRENCPSALLSARQRGANVGDFPAQALYQRRHRFSSHELRLVVAAAAAAAALLPWLQ